MEYYEPRRPCDATQATSWPRRLLLSRLDNRATRAQAWALHEVLVAQFIASHEHAPEELVLDIGASDVAARPAGTRGLLVLRPGDAGVLPASQQNRRAKHAEP
jgi:hypothetical protein